MAAARSTRKPTITKKLVTRTLAKLELAFFGFVVMIGTSVLLVVEFVALLSAALLSMTVVAGSVVTPRSVWVLLPVSAEPLLTTAKPWPVFLLVLVLVLVPVVAGVLVLVLVLVPVVAGGAVLAGGVVVPAGGVGGVGVGGTGAQGP